MDATPRRIPLPATVYLNLAALKSRLDEHNVRICYLPMLRQFITGRDYPDGQRLTIPRMVLVVPEGCEAEYRGFLLDRPNTQTEYRVVSVPDPDAFIRFELGDLEASTAVAMFDRMPSTEFFERLRAIKLRLVLLCKRAPANLESLLERGVFGVVALSKFTRTSFQPNPELPAAHDLITQEVIQLTGPDAGTIQRPPDPAADADAVNGAPPVPEAATIEGTGGTVRAEVINEGREELPGHAELTELARELPQKTMTSADNDVTGVAPPADAQPNGGRAIIVVDAQNLNKAMNTSFAAPGRQINIDFLKLREILAERFAVVGAYFVSRHAQTTGSIKFFEAMRKRGYEMIVPETRLQPGDSWDDLQIIDNLPRWAADVETVILVSGDGGYIRALHELAEAGKKIVIAFLAGSTHQKLKTFDEFIDLTDYRDDLCRGDREQPSPAKIIGNYRLVIEVDAPLSQGPAIGQLLSEWMANPAWAELGLHPTIDFSFSNRLPK